jgi:hypothetical protein
VSDFNRRFLDRFEPWTISSAANEPLSAAKGDGALAIQRVLKREQLTMIEVSARTRMRFGEHSPYFIPPTFLYKQRAGVTPHICQVIAFSEVTRYRLADCMKLCGFNLALILQLQLAIPNERTIMLTPERDMTLGNLASDQSKSREHPDKSRYCYAKIGTRDAVLYPLVRPGNIIRADRHYSPELLKRSSLEHLWLVEHPVGITCCRLKAITNSEVVLLPHIPPLSSWPLQLSTHVRILGLVIGQMQPHEETTVDPLLRVTEPKHRAMSSGANGKTTFSDLLRESRLRTGLTFRRAHQLTLQVAHLLENPDFRISTGLLSDYEAMNKFPRHIAKFITLCVIYGIDPGKLLTAGGIRIQNSGNRPLFKHANTGGGEGPDQSSCIRKMPGGPQNGNSACSVRASS